MNKKTIQKFAYLLSRVWSLYPVVVMALSGSYLNSIIELPFAGSLSLWVVLLTTLALSGILHFFITSFLQMRISVKRVQEFHGPKGHWLKGHIDLVSYRMHGVLAIEPRGMRSFCITVWDCFSRWELHVSSGVSLAWKIYFPLNLETAHGNENAFWNSGCISKLSVVTDEFKVVYIAKLCWSFDDACTVEFFSQGNGRKHKQPISS